MYQNESVRRLSAAFACSLSLSRFRLPCVSLRRPFALPPRHRNRRHHDKDWGALDSSWPTRHQWRPNRPFEIRHQDHTHVAKYWRDTARVARGEGGNGSRRSTAWRLAKGRPCCWTLKRMMLLVVPLRSYTKDAKEEAAVGNQLTILLLLSFQQKDACLFCCHKKKMKQKIKKCCAIFCITIPVLESW